MDYMADDNIIVCSSGHITNVAISKIRLSGKIDLNLLNQFFSIDLVKVKPRYCYYTNLVHEGEIIDDIVLVYFNSPHSYTGEDILELDVHGSVLNVKRVLDLFIENAGFRTANPGEFSYRALKNKKLSLSQVEGLDLILNANSIFSLKQGRSLVSGKIREDFEALYKSFLNHKSAVEFSIDFYEDMGEENARKQFNDSLLAFSAQVEKLTKHIVNNTGSLLEPTVALIGEPNAGKSTFFNHILAEERSIVSDIAGTTRDFVSETVIIDNNLFKLIDTAGLRNSSDPIEQMGVERSLKVASTSFYNMLIVNPFSYNLESYKGLENISLDLIIFTHNDLENFENAVTEALSKLSKIFGPIEPAKSGPIGPKIIAPIEPVNFVSVGLKDRAKTALIEASLVKKYSQLIASEPFLVKRHSEVIDNIQYKLNNYKDLVLVEDDISIISFELNLIGNCISELIGIVSPDDVLHNIFNNFCIGK